MKHSTYQKVDRAMPYVLGVLSIAAVGCLVVGVVLPMLGFGGF